MRKYLIIAAVAACACFVPGVANAAAPDPGLFSPGGTRLTSLVNVAAGSSYATGDIDNDGVDEIVVGSAPGQSPRVTIYELNGTKIRAFAPFNVSMKAGINVAVGDVTGSGTRRIVVAPRRGVAPQVLVFSPNGRKFTLGFFAYARSFHGGVNLALGDVDGDGVEEIITAPGPGGGPHIRCFKFDGRLVRSFFTRETSFRGGISVTALDYNQDGRDDVVSVPQTRSLALVRIFDAQTHSLLRQFQAFGGYRGGTTVAANRIGPAERIILSANAGGGGQVLQYRPSTGKIEGMNTFPFGKSWRGGVVGVPVDRNGDGAAELLAGPGSLSLSAIELSSYANSFTPTSLSGADYQKRNVTTSVGTFAVHVVRANLDTAGLKVMTLTSTTGDCKDNCPVHPLQYYVDQVGGFAGINGSYFCPSDYASCASQDGSTYWMWYNSRTKTFINTYQNQFNTGPLLAFDTANKPYLYRRAKDFPGRSAFESSKNATLRSLLSNFPLLVVNGGYAVNEAGIDTKQRTVKSSRSGIGVKGSNLYMFVASGATVPDLGRIADALGLEYAINLDGGGSSSLVFNNAYRVGPGRNMPNAIILTTK